MGIALVILNLALFGTVTYKKISERRKLQFQVNVANDHQNGHFNNSSSNKNLVSILHIVGYLVLMAAHLLMFSRFNVGSFIECYSVKTFSMLGMVGILVPITIYTRDKDLRSEVKRLIVLDHD